MKRLLVSVSIVLALVACSKTSASSLNPPTIESREGCNATDDSECTDAEWAAANTLDPNDCSRGVDESNQESCSQ